MYAASITEMRRIAILQEIYAAEQWAAAWDVPVQAIHVIATHELNGYGLASRYQGEHSHERQRDHRLREPHP